MISFIKNNLFFILGFIGLFFIYGFADILWLRPQSMHQWRQTDCLQIAHNYLTESWNFFSPSIHNFFSDGETSGKTAGEFPLTYYIAAILWKIFGEQEFIFRIINLLFFFSGLHALYNLLKKLLNDNFWSLAITFILFTSPVIVFYSNNFLPNVPAFSCVLIGWNFFYSYFSTNRIKMLYLALGFITLGGLLKMTAYISFIVLGAFYLIDVFRIVFLKLNGEIFLKPKKAIFPFLISLIIIICWYVYAAYFNSWHGGKYTFNGLWPIWEMEKEQFLVIKKFVADIIVHQIFSYYTLIVLAGMGIALLLDFKRLNKFILVMLLLLIIGCPLFILLWFQALEAHDYYIINLIILPLFILIGFVWHLKNNYQKIFYSKFSKLVFFLFLIYNVSYAANNIRIRYWNIFYAGKIDNILYPTNNNNMSVWSVFGVNEHMYNLFCEKEEIDFWWWTGSHNSFEPLNDIEEFNRNLGIKKEDLVAYIPDQGFATSLYLMNQKGWTSGFGIENNPIVKPEEKLKEKIEDKELLYLFIGDSAYLDEEYLQPFLRNPIGNYKGVNIYSLKETSR